MKDLIFPLAAAAALLVTSGAFAEAMAWYGVCISADKPTLTFEGRATTPLGEEGVYGALGTRLQSRRIALKGA